MLKSNESYMRDYKADIEAQFELVRRTHESTTRVPTQELERITKESNQLKVELETFRAMVAKKQAEEI